MLILLKRVISIFVLLSLKILCQCLPHIKAKFSAMLLVGFASDDLEIVWIISLFKLAQEKMNCRFWTCMLAKTVNSTFPADGIFFQKKWNNKVVFFGTYIGNNVLVKNGISNIKSVLCKSL